MGCRPFLSAPLFCSLLVPVLLASTACAGPDERGQAPGGRDAGVVVRVATYNVEELSRAKVDSVDADGRGAHPQLVAAADVIRRVRPDILLLNEVDLARDGYSIDGGDPAAVVRDFQDRYLAVGSAPLRYPHVYAAPSNTGLLSGLDLDRDDTVATPAMEGTRAHGDDSFGFGMYPGQYSMAVLSMHPVDLTAVRTFQRFRWDDLPGNHLPGEFYGDSALAVLRLSSKSHWDVPVSVADATLHVLASHPTPPVFDGPEDRNGRRNYDEIGFWAYYLSGGDSVYDDAGRRGGYVGQDPFVVLGDLNADPAGGEAAYGGTPAISQLLRHPRIAPPEALAGVPTAAFGGGMRVDYVLPSRGVEVVGAGVFDPSPGDDPEGAEAAAEASDHRMVWVELRLGG